MPVIAVAAIVEGGMAIATGLEVGMTAFEAISAVGAIAGGVGQLTGNKDLMKIGAVAGLGGAVGAYAQGAGWLASDAGPLTDTSGSNIDAMIKQPNPTDRRLADGTQAAPQGTVDAQGATPDAIQQAVTQPTTGLAGATMGNPPADNNTITSTGSVQPANNDAITNPTDARLAAGTQTTPLGGAAPGKGILGYFSEFSDWANKNKTMASMLGNFVGGMFDAKRKADANLANAQADFYRQETSNMAGAPNMNIGSSGSVGFPSTAPRYSPPRVGLAGAYGGH